MSETSMIIVVRHGVYLQNGKLAKEGQIQIEQVTQKLLTLINDSKVAVLSLTDPQIIQSAGIIINHLKKKHQRTLLLERDIPSALKAIKTAQKKMGVVIIVTHLEHTREIIPVYAEKELGIKNMRKEVLSPGEAWVFDITQKPPRLELVRPN